MTSLRIISRLRRSIRAVLVAFACFAFASFTPIVGHADEIGLSDAPFRDILPLIVEDGNSGMAENAFSGAVGAIERGFVVRNDTSETVVWRLRTEMLEPLAFDFRVAGEARPFFASPFEARSQLSHASQGPVIRSEPVSMGPGETLRVRARLSSRPAQ